MNRNRQPDITCILGVHRSGTSLVSRLVNLHGVSLGPPDKLLGPKEDNLKGFWEYRPFLEINEEILTRLGGTWHEPPHFPPEWATDARLADLRQRARALIERDFDSACWAWKEPRTCLTLPFWSPLLPPFRCVICLRNPLDVARSLAQRDHFTLAKSLRLWHEYTAAALEHSAGRARLFLFYEDLLRDPVPEIRRLAHFLGKPPLDGALIQETLAAELQHHRTSFLDTADEPAFDFPGKALYVALRLFGDAHRELFRSDPEAETTPERDQLWPVFSRCSRSARALAEESARKESACRAEAEDAQRIARELGTSLEEREKAVAALRAELVEREAAQQTLTGELARRDATAAALQAALTEQAAVAEQLHGTRQALEAEAATLREELLRQRDEQGTAAAALQAALAERAALAEQLQSTRQALDSEAAALREELSHQRDEQGTAAAALQAALTERAALAEQLQSTRQALEAEAAALREELLRQRDEQGQSLARELAQRDAALHAQELQLAQRDEEARAQAEHLRGELAQREQELGAHHAAARALEREKAQLTEDLRQRNAAVQELEIRLGQLTEATQQETERLRAQETHHAARIATLQAELDKQVVSCHGVVEAVAQRDAALRDQEGHHAALIVALQAELEKQVAGCHGFAEEIAQRDAAMGNLRTALAEQTARADRLTQEQQALKVETEALRAQVHQLGYAALVRRIQVEVSSFLPADATIAVVSRGDTELLRLEGRTGWHFPADEADQYAGHYPADSAEAIRQLEALRDRGAHFLLLPRTAFWWLDHYADFARHLDASYPRVRKTGDYQIYQLSRPQWLEPAATASTVSTGTAAPAPAPSNNGFGHGTAAPAPAAAPPVEQPVSRRGKQRMQGDTYRAMVGRIRSLAETLLPQEATAVVISKGDDELLKLGRRVAWHFPQVEDGQYAGHYPADGCEAVRQLEALRARGGRFLIIPGSASWWLDHYEDLRRHLDENAEHLWRSEDCAIYQLKEVPAAPGRAQAQETAPPDPAAAVLARTPLDRYDAWLEVNGWSERRAADLRARLAAAQTRPLFSIVMPVYNPPPRFLEKALQTIRDQVYDHWELCIADDASTDPEVGRILREWQTRDERIKVCYRAENGNISRSTNSAAELATGDFLVLVDHDDELEPDALGEVALYLAAHPETDLVYSDDDKIDEHGRRYAPQFKPDWSPELLLSYMYLSHLFVLRRSLFWRAGAMRLGFEGSQDYDLALRATELTCAIGHIPRVLYHWRALPGSTATSGAEKPHSFQAGLRAVQEALERRRVEGRAVQPDWAVRARCGIFAPCFPDQGPRVAILIPTKNNPSALRVCLESLRQTSYANYEVVVIDNESEDAEARAYLHELPHRVLRIANPGGRFNYAAINNQAVRQVEADLVLFLNDDTEVLEPGWLSQMVGYLGLEGVGAVGARLLYPDGRVQHAGVVHGYWNGQVGHAFKGLSGQDAGYQGYARVARNCAGGTGACLLTRRDTFLALGGFDEQDFAVAYNDVDYCHRLRQRGLRIAYCPDAELIHFESQTRGFVNDPAELARYLRKTRGMADPYYNLNLSTDDEFFRIAARTIGRAHRGRIPALLCTHNLNWEGAPYSQLELTRWLKKHGGVEPLVYSPFDGPLRHKYEENGIRVEVFDHPVAGIRCLADYEQAVTRFADFLRRQQVEVVYGNTLETFFAIDAARIAGLPSVWNPRESEPWQTYFSRYGPEVAGRALACFGYPYQVVFVSNATRAGCRPLDLHHNFTTVHNGLDRGRMEEALTRWPRDQARAELGVPEEAVVALLLGTVCERKGQLDLVEALARLDDGCADRLYSLIVGDRPSAYSQQLHEARGALPGPRRARLRIVPETADTAFYYAAADLFVCASRIESFPRVILEAMAAGLPIVTTPVFGIPEQVRENINGLFYQPGDSAALAEALSRLVRDPPLRRRLADKSMSVLETINDYETMAAAYARILHEAWLSGGPRPCAE
jgi:GT2 family glycosyltransferase/glycosyltransferase involved in cell wall biosynthesis